MKRAEQSEMVKRINRAYALLGQNQPQEAVVVHLMEKYEISQIQAYRYVQKAKKLSGHLAVPEQSVVFTVKLAPSLIVRIRKLAKDQGLSISKIVKKGMEEFLAREEDGAF